MFGLSQIQAALKSRGLDKLIEVPSMMTNSFRECIINFEQLNGFQAEIKRDPIANVVRQELENYLLRISTHADEKLSSAFGTFWKYTRLAMKPFAVAAKLTWKLGWYVMNNPFYVVVITFILRCVRIVTCLYTSFPTIGDQLLNYIVCQVFNKITDEGENSGFGVVKLVVQFAYQVLKCLMKVGTAVYTGGVAAWEQVTSACVAEFATESLGNLANVLGQFFKATFKTVLDKLGLGMVADFAIQLYDNPGRMFDAFWNFNVTSAVQIDISIVVQNFTFMDWDVVGFLFFIAKAPPAMINRIFAFVLPVIAPYLLPQVLAFQLTLWRLSDRVVASARQQDCLGQICVGVHTRDAGVGF